MHSRVHAFKQKYLARCERERDRSVFLLVLTGIAAFLVVLWFLIPALRRDDVRPLPPGEVDQLLAPSASAPAPEPIPAPFNNAAPTQPAPTHDKPPTPAPNAPLKPRIKQ